MSQTRNKSKKLKPTSANKQSTAGTKVVRCFYIGHTLLYLHVVGCEQLKPTARPLRCAVATLSEGEDNEVSSSDDEASSISEVHEVSVVRTIYSLFLRFTLLTFSLQTSKSGPPGSKRGNFRIIGSKPSSLRENRAFVRISPKLLVHIKAPTPQRRDLPLARPDYRSPLVIPDIPIIDL
jgi:hypothetical protein